MAPEAPALATAIVGRHDRPPDPHALLAPPRHRPAPTGAEALDEPFNAFPSWFLCITCARCGQERMVNQAHAAKSDLPLREILAKMRHDGCGGSPGRSELLTGIEGVSSRPVRKIMLRDG